MFFFVFLQWKYFYLIFSDCSHSCIHTKNNLLERSLSEFVACGFSPIYSLINKSMNEFKKDHKINSISWRALQVTFPSVRFSVRDHLNFKKQLDTLFYPEHVHSHASGSFQFRHWNGYFPFLKVVDGTSRTQHTDPILRGGGKTPTTDWSVEPTGVVSSSALWCRISQLFIILAACSLFLWA